MAKIRLVYLCSLFFISNVSAQIPETPEPAMTNEDQEVIEANYERTKTDYASDAEDPLFSKVSKAYVRNLDKILTRKKNIEN